MIHLSRSRFSAFLALGLLFVCALTDPIAKGHAMGSPASQTRATHDIALPAPGLKGHIARDDTAAPTPDMLRLYSSADPAAPASIRAQAQLVLPVLRDLSALPPLADVTQRATALGASPQALARHIHGDGKYTQPNALLALTGPDSAPALVLARIAADDPQAAVNVTLYCLARGANEAITIAHFGPVRPDSMIEIKEKICGIDFH